MAERQELERRLVERVKEGDRDAVARLYQKHSSLVYTRVRQMCGDDHLAEDLSQECWIRVFEKIGQFKGKASFSGWIYRIATNLVIDHFRQAQPEAELEEEELPVANPPPDFPEPLELSLELQECLDALPDGYRTVLLLRVLDQLSHDEIAQRLGVESVTSRTQFYKAKARMVQCLEARAGGKGDEGS